MLLDRISYQKVFPISMYCTERIGLEASLDEKDNPETSLERLKVLVETLHSATIASLDEFRGTQVKEIEKVPVNPVESMITAITTCTTIEVLRTFEKLAKSKSEFMEAYMETMDKLTNKIN